MGLEGDRSSGAVPRVLARVGMPHGLRGEVTIEVRTDDPETRLAPGTTLAVEPADNDVLTVRSVRIHQGTYLVAFDGVSDRSEAERLRGVRLVGDSASHTDPPETGGEEYYEDELVGLRVETAAGEHVGQVSALHTRPAQDLLEVRILDDSTALVPFVAALVPVVDVAAGRVVIDPPPGLLDLDR